MTDSFNPQELLSKLRAKSTNSTAASMSGSISQDPPMRRNSFNPEAEQKANSANRIQQAANIRTPISLTLTPSQRQENLNARLELEKEIKRLQDEVANLSSENLQLKRDKEDVEQQFIEFRMKSEDTITKLRGQIAAYNLHQEGLPDRGAGAGRLYGQRPPGSANKLNTSASRSPNSKKQVGTPTHSTPQMFATHNEGPPPPPPPPMGGFRDPTFSELMRRSTPEHHDFREALRRNGNTKLGTGVAPAPLGVPAAGGGTPGVGGSHAVPHGSHGAAGSGAGMHYAPPGANAALNMGTPNASNAHNAPVRARAASASHILGGNQFLFSDGTPTGESKQLGGGQQQHAADGGNGYQLQHRSSVSEMDAFMSNAHHATHSQSNLMSLAHPQGSSKFPTGNPPNLPAASNAGPMDLSAMSNMGNNAPAQYGHHGHHAAHHGGGHGGAGAYGNLHHGQDFGNGDGNSMYSDGEDMAVLEIDLSG